MNHPGKGTPNPSIHIGAHFKHLRILLDLALSFSDGFLQDFLAMHKAVRQFLLSSSFGSSYNPLPFL